MTRDDVEGSGASSSDPDTPSEGEPVPKKEIVVSIKRKYSGSPVNKEITICMCTETLVFLY